MTHHTLLLILVLSLVSGLVWAAPPTDAADNPYADGFQYAHVPDSSGYLVAVPRVRVETLALNIKATRTALRERRAQLDQLEKDSEFSVIDVLITLVAPGGLLYAGYKMHAQTEAKEALASVDQDLAQLDTDLLAFQMIAGREFLAMGP